MSVVDLPIGHASTLGDEAQAGDEMVVRVRFPLSRRLYAYRVPFAVAVGSDVMVVTPISGVEVVPVMALGRGGYTGPLKMAMPLGRRS